MEGERQAGFVLTVDVTGLRLNLSRSVVIKTNGHKSYFLDSSGTLFCKTIFSFFLFNYLISVDQVDNP